MDDVEQFIQFKQTYYEMHQLIYQLTIFRLWMVKSYCKTNFPMKALDQLLARNSL